MSVLIVASSEPRVGRSLIAAAVAYRLGRAGVAVTLARLDGDDSAAADAAAFAALDGIVSHGTPVPEGDVAALAGNVVLEAPAAAISAIAKTPGSRVLVVALANSAPVVGDNAQTIITRVTASEAAVVASRSRVVAVLAEDRTLATPSVRDIGAALRGKWLAEADTASSIDRVMIGTVASDAASPYFGARIRKCVVTRFDKTDIQLAALQTDTELLVLTGGGQPSPYLIDRVVGYRDDISVLLAEESTVEAMKVNESLYATSRFEGQGKLDRAVEMLDAAGFEIDL